MYEKGDLFNLNEQGLDLFKHISGSVGVVVSDPKMMYEHQFEEKTIYYAYDILVSGQLFMDIPGKFLDRITKNEKNTE